MADSKLDIILTAKDLSGAAFKQLNGNISSTAGHLTKMGLAFATIATGTGAYALGRIASDIGRAVDTASDLQEASSKFGVVFADQINIARQWSQELVDSYGTSQREAAQYLGSMQDLLVPMGMASDAAGRMSNAVVRLAVDLGSFNNQTTAKVMEDMQSALVGNYETMKKYGVVLNEAAVKNEALRSGLVKSKDEIDASVKAQAAYNLIVKGSQAAIGDFSRTSDEHANTTKRLASAWEDASAALGEKFLPSITRAKSELADLLRSQEAEGFIDTVTHMLTRLEDAAAARDRLAASEVGQLNERLAVLKRELRSESTFFAFSKEERQAHSDRRVALLEEIGLINERKALVLAAQSNKFAGATVAQSIAKPGDDKPIIDATAAARELEQQMKALDAAVSASMANVWDETGYDIDKGVDQLAAAIQKLELERNNLAIRTQRNIELNAGVEDTWDLDQGDRMAGYEEEFSYLESLSQRTSDAMEQNFSDFVYNLRDGFDDIGDFFQAMSDSMWRVWSDMLGQMIKEFAFGKDGSGGLGSFVGDLFKNLTGLSSGSSSKPVHVGSTGNTAFRMADGGYIGEPVMGIGQRSGSSYQFHPNEWVLPERKLGGVAGGQTVNVNLSLSVSAIDTQTGIQWIDKNINSIAAKAADKFRWSPELRNKMRDVVH